MNRDIAQQWAEALKSGEYQQGSGALRRVNTAGTGHCCLGVLCELHKKAVGGTWEKTEGRDTTRYHPSRQGQEGYVDASANYLPTAVRTWAGIGEGSPTVHSKIAADYYGKQEGTPLSLAQVNDGDVVFSADVAVKNRFTVKMPFAIIADVILETQEEL